MKPSTIAALIIGIFLITITYILLIIIILVNKSICVFRIRIHARVRIMMSMYVIIDYGQILLTFLCGIHTFLLLLYSLMINFAQAKTI